MPTRARFALALWLGLMLELTLGCDDPEASTQPGCNQGELSTELEFRDSPSDVLLIIEPELSGQLLPRLLALISAQLSGEIDDVPGQDVWVAPAARFGAVSVDTARAFVDRMRCIDEAEDPSKCPRVALPFARYRYAPYGYADDPDELAQRVLCLLGTEPDACASPDEPGETLFGFNPTIVLLVTTADVCDPFGDELTCDQTLSSLVRTWTASRTLRDSWWPVVIAGAPAELTTLTAFDAAGSRNDYLRLLANDPRMLAARGTDACAGSGAFTAEPARELLRALAMHGDGVLSVCADDYRPVLGMVDCGGWADGFYNGFDPARVQVAADGLAECDFEELLPATGPITHCAQLAEFGRAAEPVAIEDGRELCRLDQLTGDDGRAGRGYGWYLADAEHDNLAPVPTPPCRGFLGGRGVLPTFAQGTERIPNSTLRTRCATATPDVPQCDAPDAGR